MSSIAGVLVRVSRVGAAPLAVATSHGLRLLVGLTITKAVAVHLGPMGLGQLGNFMSLTTALAVFAGGGIANGVTKFVAEYGDANERLHSFVRACTIYGLAYSFLLAGVSVVFAVPLSEALFGAGWYWWLVTIAGLMQVPGSIGTIAVGVVNGLRRVDLLGLITIPTYLVIIPLCYGLVVYQGVAGGALALVISITALGVPGLFALFRLGVVSGVARAKVVPSDLLDLAKFSFMLLASAALFPLAETAIRSQISSVLGVETAGIWQALTRLSTAYLGFFSVYLASIYLPAISRLEWSKVGGVMTRQFRNSIVAFAAFGSLLFLVRDVAVHLLLSDEFLVISDVLLMQLVGDAFRLGSYVVGFVLLAKGQTRLYITCECVQMLFWVVSAYSALHVRPELATLSQFYAVAYLAYLLFVSAVTYQRLLKRQ